MQLLSIMSPTSFVLVSRTPSRQLQLLPSLRPMAGKMLSLYMRTTIMVLASSLSLLMPFKMLTLDTHVIYRGAIPAYYPDNRIDEELCKLMTMQTRVFIVHMMPAHASHFFARVSALGMMAEGYVWIVTSNIGIALDVLPHDTIENMQGVIGFQSYVAKSARIIEFMTRFVTLFRAKYHQNHDVRMTGPTVFQYWAYDVAWAVAAAAEKVKRVQFSNIGFQTPEYVGKNLVDDLLVSPAGPELLSSILEADFDGLTGRFRFAERYIQIPIYELVNVIGEKARGIGFWSPGSGLSMLLNSSPSQGQVKSSTSAIKVLKSIIWPGDPTAVPKGHKIESLKSKVVVVIWCLVVQVLVQSYTASLSSSQTAQRLQPSVTDPKQLLRDGHYVGYQNGSFVHAILRRFHFNERKIKVYGTMKEYAGALRNGTKHGGVSAIFDEIPYLNSFLAQYGDEFQEVGPVDRTNGFGFVFPMGSPLVPDLSKAILNFTEAQEALNIHRKWFGDADATDYGSPHTDSARLNFRSFKGLFIINRFVLSFMFLIYLLEFIRAYWTNHSPQHSHGNAESENEPQPLQNGIITDSVPEPFHVEIVGDNDPQQVQNGMATNSVPYESLP